MQNHTHTHTHTHTIPVTTIRKGTSFFCDNGQKRLLWWGVGGGSPIFRALGAGSSSSLFPQNPPPGGVSRWPWGDTHKDEPWGPGNKTRSQPHHLNEFRPPGTLKPHCSHLWNHNVNISFSMGGLDKIMLIAWRAQYLPGTQEVGAAP